jgi:signal transduction histidine kinase
MTFIEIAFYLLVSFSSVSLSFFIIQKKKSKEANYFSFLMMTAGLWVFLVFLFFYFNNSTAVLWLGRSTFAISLVMLIFLFDFVRSFPKSINFLEKKLIYWSIKTFTIFVAGLTLFTPFIIKDEIITGVNERETILGSLFALWVFCFIVLFLFSVFALLFQYKKAEKGVSQKQILYIFIGAGVAIVFGFLNTVILPFLNFQGSEKYGVPMALLIFFGFSSYTILRYRLMDIRLAFTRGVIYFLSLFSIVFLGIILFFIIEKTFSFVHQKILISLIIIISVFIFQPIVNFFKKLCAKYFYYSFYNYQKVLTELGEKLTTILDIEKLSILIINTLVEVMKLDRAVILLKDKKEEKYYIQRNIGFNVNNGISLVKDNFLTEYLEKTKKPLVYEELSLLLKETEDKNIAKKIKELQKDMLRIEANICLPLTLDRKIVGIIVLGEKISGDPYFKQDIDLLTNLANQASIALYNAKLHSEVQDLSENLEKKVEEQVGELQTAYKKLQRIDKMKTEFISIVSHQLRTPLSVIKGHLSMVNEGVYDKEPEKKAKILNDVYEANERLIGLVNDVLNASRIQSGRVEISKEKADITKVIKDVVEKLMPSAKEKGLKMIFHEPEKQIPKINIDVSKVENILINFIDNAIKYTNDGSVEVYLHQEEDGVVISIKDTGDGMNQEELEKLFETFSRGGAGKKYWIQGAGLGLYIARQFTELHKGKVWAESEGKGKGSSFYIKLPI